MVRSSEQDDVDRVVWLGKEGERHRHTKIERSAVSNSSLHNDRNVVTTFVYFCAVFSFKIVCERERWKDGVRYTM